MQHKIGIALLLLIFGTASLVEAQTRRAQERRADRTARQAQRQLNRAEYFSADAWSQINPWIQQ
jgi:hypothetical protein